MLRVACAIIEDRNRILAAQRSWQMDMPLKWELPGGKIREGESEKDCIIREIREELNLDISIKERLPEFFHQYENKSICLIPFRCSVLQGTIRLAEHLQVKWLKKKDVWNMQWCEADISVLKYYFRNHRT